jgi:hypothetical protein
MLYFFDLGTITGHESTDKYVSRKTNTLVTWSTLYCIQVWYWIAHVVSMLEKRIAYKCLVRNPKRKKTLGRTGRSGMVILRWLREVR